MRLTIKTLVNAVYVTATYKQTADVITLTDIDAVTFLHYLVEKVKAIDMAPTDGRPLPVSAPATSMMSLLSLCREDEVQQLII